ncbi:MAG: discoidin domain-containing protein [Eubacteriales bacterium]|nr:discoidin domain-containing protein [Eubacteriales bacterium]
MQKKRLYGAIPSVVLIIIIMLTAFQTAVSASGKNLCADALLHGSSGYINDEEQDVFAFDGNIDTKWCATYDNIIMSDETLKVFDLGYLHWFAIDLGEAYYFDSYKLIHASQGLRDLGVYGYNAVAWAVQISDDGIDWMTVSEFRDNYDEITEVFMGRRYARYVRLMISQPEANGGSTVRLPEFELYECAAGETTDGIVGKLQTTAPETETKPAIETEIISEEPPETEPVRDSAQNTGIRWAAVIITALAALGVSAAAYYRKLKLNPSRPVS